MFRKLRFLLFGAIAQLGIAAAIIAAVGYLTARQLGTEDDDSHVD